MSLKDTKTSTAVVRMKFVGGTNSATPSPIGELPGKTSYLVGNDSSKWVSGLPEYTQTPLRKRVPGNRCPLSGRQKKLRYDFVVKPGASPASSRWRLKAQTISP